MKKDTIIRTVLLAVALINQILTSTGHSVIPVSDDQIVEVLTLVLTIGASVWGWWNNNSFSKKAIQADMYLDMIRKEENK